MSTLSPTHIGEVLVSVMQVYDSLCFELPMWGFAIAHYLCRELFAVWVHYFMNLKTTFHLWKGIIMSLTSVRHTTLLYESSLCDGHRSSQWSNTFSPRKEDDRFPDAYHKTLMILSAVQLAAHFCNMHGVYSYLLDLINWAARHSWNVSSHVFKAPIEYFMKPSPEPPSGIISNIIGFCIMSAIHTFFVIYALFKIYSCIRHRSTMSPSDTNVTTSKIPVSSACYNTHMKLSKVLLEAFSGDLPSSGYRISFDSDYCVFIADNSANCHICKDESLYVGPMKKMEFDENFQVQTANGITSPQGIGTIKLVIIDDEGVSHTELINDVLFFPDSPVNILGITRLGLQRKDDEGTYIMTKAKYSRFVWNFGTCEKRIIHPPSSLPELVVNEGTAKCSSFYSALISVFPLLPESLKCYNINGRPNGNEGSDDLRAPLAKKRKLRSRPPLECKCKKKRCDTCGDCSSQKCSPCSCKSNEQPATIDIDSSLQSDEDSTGQGTTMRPARISDASDPFSVNTSHHDSSLQSDKDSTGQAPTTPPRRSTRVSSYAAPQTPTPNKIGSDQRTDEILKVAAHNPNHVTDTGLMKVVANFAREKMPVDDYYANVANEDSPMISVNKPASKTSFNKMPGREILSIGDACEAFEGPLADIGAFKKRFGSSYDRSSNENMEDGNSNQKKVFSFMTTQLCKCTEHLAAMFYPANARALCLSSARALTSQFGSGDERMPIPKKLHEHQLTALQGFREKILKGSLVKQAVECSMYLLQRTSLPRDARANAKQNLKTVEDEGNLEKQRYSKERKDPSVIRKVVEFILQPDKVQHLSWGYTEFDLGDNDIVVLPNLLRCQQREHLWNEYDAAMEGEQNKENRIQRTLFLDIAANITRGGDYKSISCVDYVLGNLVNDPVERLQEIISRLFARDSITSVKFTNDLGIMRDFLKVRFDRHLLKEDGDAFHSLTHGLTKGDHNNHAKCRTSSCNVCSSSSSLQNDSEHNVEQTVKCQACKFPFYLCGKLRAVVEHCANQQEHHESQDSDDLQDSSSSIDIENESQRASSSPTNFSNNHQPNSESPNSTSQDDRRENATPDNPHIPQGSSSYSREDSRHRQHRPDSTRLNSRHDESDTNDSHDYPPLNPQHVMEVDHEFCENAKRVIDDCEEKFYFYMRHRVRVACQRSRYDALITELHDECLESRKTTGRVFIIIDFKQKFESMVARETMPENFGKRGMAWHGSSIIFFVWAKDKDEVYKPIKKVIYMDQILDKTNKQDALSVLSLIEALAAALIAQFPADVAIDATLCSDNAGCYLSKLLLIVITILNAKHHGKFFISRIMHTETQDGKGITDSHFAIMMRWLRTFVTNFIANKIRRINTPPGLAYALSWRGGVANSSVQLVEVDRDHIEFLANFLKDACKKLGEWFKQRASEIRFPPPSEDAIQKVQNIVWNNQQSVTDGLSDLKVSFEASCHSGYGKYVRFDIELGEKPSVSIDSEAETEYRGNLGYHDQQQPQSTVSSTMEPMEPDEDDVGDSNNSEEEDRIEGFETHAIVFDGTVEDFTDRERIVSDDDSITEDITRFEEVHSTRVSDDLPYGPPTHEAYNPGNFVTQARVIKTSYYSHIEDVTREIHSKTNLTTRSRSIKKKGTDPKIKRKDGVAVAIRIAYELIENDDLFVAHQASDDCNELYLDAKDYHFDQGRYKLNPGWARRANGGDDLFGAKYMELHKEKILEMVELGNENSHMKKSPAQALHSIREGASENERLLLPSEYEVRLFINASLNKKKNDEGSDDAIGNGRRRGSAHRVIPDEVGIWLQHVYLRMGHVFDRPKQILNAVQDKFRTKYPELCEKENDKDIRAEITTMRTKVKNSAIQDMMQ